MYTNIFKRGDFLYIREPNKQFKKEFNPSIWINSKPKDFSGEIWKTLHDEPVYEMKMGSIKESDDFVKKYKDIDNIDLFETPNHVCQYIADTYPNEIKWDKKDINIFIIDIETQVELGKFPQPSLAEEEINLITILDVNTNKMVTFGTLEYNGIENIDYRFFHKEKDMLHEFVMWFSQRYPDVISGWNSDLFDLVYLYTRLEKVFDSKFAKKLSPWGIVTTRTVNIFDKEELKVDIKGISSLDYLDLYKKYGTYSNKESYKLESICQEILGTGKLENPGDSFKDFYTNHSTTFIQYNRIDVDLVKQLDDALGLFDLAFTIAYSAGVNYEDIFSPVKTWDSIIFNHLYKEKTVIPRLTENKIGHFEGGYVKEPIVGRHNWVCSFDVDSMYPHLIMEYNLSPETILDNKIEVTINDLLNRTKDLSFLKEENITMASNGCLFRKDKQGILPKLMHHYYNERLTTKALMIEKKKELETAIVDKERIKKEIEILNNKQMSLKILINSAFGILGNDYCRYSDPRIAEAITLSGQFAIQWIANKLNHTIQKSLQDDKDRIILIDTDSVVLSLEDMINKIYPNHTTQETIEYINKVANEILQPIINNSFEELGNYTNCYEYALRMKLENTVDTMISIGKKNYVMNVHCSEGVMYKKPKKKIMGLQMVKSSTPAIIREKLKTSLDSILFGNESDIQKFVNDYEKEFYKLNVNDIAFPRGVSDINKWEISSTLYKKGTPIHVRGAILYNNLIKKMKLEGKYNYIHNGNKMKFVYLKKPNPIQENCIAFIDELPKEFGLHSYIDYDIMFEKTFEDPIKNVIKPLDWTTKQQSNLNNFFTFN